MIFGTFEDLESWWEKSGDPWFAVEDAHTDLYLIFSTEDDAAFRGVPVEEDEDGKSIDYRTGPLSDFSGAFPLKLLEPLDEDTLRRTAERAWDAAVAVIEKNYFAGPTKDMILGWLQNPYRAPVD